MISRTSMLLARGVTRLRKHVRADRRTVIEEVTQAGFDLIDELLELRDNFFVRFRKDSP